MSSFVRRTWAEIDLDALAHNYGVIRRTVRPSCKIMSVVKADAYGHGAEFVAPLLQELGSDWFAVSNLEEAIQLRNHQITKPILILGFTPPENADLLAKYQITQAVYSLSYAMALGKMAASYQAEIDIHIKVDTGMSRIGFMYQNEEDAGSLEEIVRACQVDGLKAKGIFTHFAVSDEKEEGRKYTLEQYRHFTSCISALEKRGVFFELRHCCNSGGVMDYSEMCLDMVRPGIILYGLWPSQKLAGQMDLHPAMELKSTVSLVKEVRPGTAVSYGCTYHADSRKRIATVPIGYADGYARQYGGRAEMLVQGHRAPVIGRVCMDQLLLDITGIPNVREGDTVTVFGRDGEEFLSVDELSQLGGSINYETVCLVGKRVPRIYYRQGQRMGMLNYICPESL